MTFRVTGLFIPERQADLQEVLKQIPEITLVNLDYKTAEGTFQFDSAKAFPGAKPEQIAAQFDQRLRGITNSTFGIKPPSTIPREKQKYVEIAVVGLDCKACCLAAYEIVYQLEGVEQATASFKQGLITAWIDPEKTDQAKLEMALSARNVQLKATSVPDSR